MIKRIFTIVILLFSFFYCTNQVNSIELSDNTLEKYVYKISRKFSSTYCNTIKFGISNKGALEFALGETKKEFKNNKNNELIDYSLLKNNIVNNLEKNSRF